MKTYKVKLKNSIIFRTILYLGLSTIAISIVSIFGGYLYNSYTLNKKMIDNGYSLLNTFVEETKDSISKGQRKTFQRDMDSIAKIDVVKETALYSIAGLMTNDDDRKGARNVLTAAGMTYLAAAVTSILQLLYYISLANRRG